MSMQGLFTRMKPAGQHLQKRGTSLHVVAASSSRHVMENDAHILQLPWPSKTPKYFNVIDW